MPLLGAIRGGKFLTAGELAACAPAPDRADFPTPQLSRDYAPYRSPLGTGWIDGRAARREDMARGNCRPLERGEGCARDGYVNRAFCQRHGLEWAGSSTPAPVEEAAPFVRSTPDKRRLARGRR